MNYNYRYRLNPSNALEQRLAWTVDTCRQVYNHFLHRLNRNDDTSSYSEQQRLSSMTLFELYYGIARAADSETERETVEHVLASKPIHPADTAVMRKAGRLSGNVQNNDTPVGDGDVITGATADVVEEPVLTRNVEDFNRLGVDIETY